MLVHRDLPGQWRLWFSPVHVHLLFVGWFFQFTNGVAYWLLPRRRTPARKTGYREDFAFLAIALLNLGLAHHLGGRLPAAVQAYEECLTVCQAIDLPLPTPTQ